MNPDRIALTVAADQPGPKISRHIFGQFAEHLGRCVYEGIWVGEESPIPNVRGIRSDVLAALRAIRVPNLRWPGGCFADAYHWRNGIGPREKRPLMRNDTWGQVETNAFGTHEFLDLCAQVGCEPVICGNLGSGTVQEMRDWVEYLNAPVGTVLANERAANGHPAPYGVRFWGVGNESWGCGGVMTAEYYANEFRRYSGFLGNYEKTRLFRIATGPGLDDYAWTDVIMRECTNPRYNGAVMDGLSLHYYMNGGIPPGKVNTPLAATKFDHDGWRTVMAHGWFLDELLTKHTAIMDRHDPTRRVALCVDEWGSWYVNDAGRPANELYQQQTVRDAVLAALTFNLFIAHAERVQMANIAQVIKVLQSMILTFGEKMVCTPSWHAFGLYTPHHDAARLPVTSDAAMLAHDGLPYPRVSATASLATDKSVTVTLAHTDPAKPVTVELTLTGCITGNRSTGNRPTGQILTASALTDTNTPDDPNRVATKPWTDFNFDGTKLIATLPPGCVAAITLAK